MKRQFFLLLLLFPLVSSAQNWEWLRGAGLGASGGGVSTIDTEGNIYTSGAHWSPVSFGSDTVSGAGVYVVKHDSAGNVIWAITTNSLPSSSSANGLVTDRFGNLYLLGTRDTTVLFGSFVLPIPGPSNWYYYLAKIKWDGTVQWLKNIGNVAGVQGAITVDNSGNLYISGCFFNNPTLGSFSLTNSATDGSADILVTKLDSSGNTIWAKSYGGKNDDRAQGIVRVQESGNIYILGNFNSDTLSFGTTMLRDTAYTTSPTHPYSHMFLAKLDATGNPIWARNTEGKGTANTWGGLAVDIHENVFIGANYQYTSNTLTSMILPNPPYNSSYGFVAKYNSTGNAVWLKIIKGRSVGSSGIVLDPCENVWIRTYMGYGHITTNDTIDGHIIAPPSINGSSNFISEWTNSGSFITAFSIPSGGEPGRAGIVTDKYSNIYVSAGQTNCDTLVLGNDTLINTPFSGSMFVAKYNPDIFGDCNHLESRSIPVNENTVVIYPNPAYYEINIEGSDIITDVIICNLVGQVLYRQEYNEEHVQISISSFPPGIYLAKVNGLVVRKFVKQ